MHNGEYIVPKGGTARKKETVWRIFRTGIHNSLGVDREQSASHVIEDTCDIVDDGILCPSSTAPITITITRVIVRDGSKLPKMIRRHHPPHRASDFGSAVVRRPSRVDAMFCFGGGRLRRFDGRLQFSLPTLMLYFGGGRLRRVDLPELMLCFAGAYEDWFGSIKWPCVIQYPIVSHH